MSRLMFYSLKDINLPGWTAKDDLQCSKRVNEKFEAIISMAHFGGYQVQLYIKDGSFPELEYSDHLIASCVGVAEGWLKKYREAELEINEDQIC